MSATAPADDDYEPMHKEVNKILMDPAIGPVLYWDMVRVGYVEDGSKWIATEWRTVPDYQGGECARYPAEIASFNFSGLPHSWTSSLITFGVMVK